MTALPRLDAVQSRVRFGLTDGRGLPSVCHALPAPVSGSCSGSRAASRSNSKGGSRAPSACPPSGREEAGPADGLSDLGRARLSAAKEWFEKEWSEGGAAAQPPRLRLLLDDSPSMRTNIPRVASEPLFGQVGATKSLGGGRAGSKFSSSSRSPSKSSPLAGRATTRTLSRAGGGSPGEVLRVRSAAFQPTKGPRSRGHRRLIDLEADSTAESSQHTIGGRGYSGSPASPSRRRPWSSCSAVSASPWDPQVPRSPTRRPDGPPAPPTPPSALENVASGFRGPDASGSPSVGPPAPPAEGTGIWAADTLSFMVSKPDKLRAACAARKGHAHATKEASGSRPRLGDIMHADSEPRLPDTTQASSPTSREANAAEPSGKRSPTKARQSFARSSVLSRQASSARISRRETLQSFARSLMDDLMGLDVDDTASVADVKLAPSLEEAVARVKGADIHGAGRQRMSLAFKRFSQDGAREMSKSCLHDALVHLGFLTGTEEHTLEIAEKAFAYSVLDPSDFATVVSKYAQSRRAELLQEASAWLAARDEFPNSVEDLQSFLRNVGFFVPESVAQWALEAVCQAELEEDDAEELLWLLAASTMGEGFTGRDIARARRAFEAICRGTGSALGPEGGGVACREELLHEGLLGLHGPYVEESLIELLGCLPERMVGTKVPGVCFYEFLVWSRRLHQIETRQLFERFQMCDQDDGRIELGEALKILTQLDVTVFSECVREVCQGLDMEPQDQLDFDTLVLFVAAVRRCHGFPAAEIREYLEAFARFAGTGPGDKISTYRLPEVLRYLGYSWVSGMDKVLHRINQVDTSMTGEIDRPGFLYFMRLMREPDILSAQIIFDRVRGACSSLPSILFASALQDLDGREELDRSLLRVEAMPETLTFEEFAAAAQHYRASKALEGRRRAGFSERVFKELEHGHNKLCLPGQGLLTQSELIRALSEFMPSVNTAQGRQDLQETISTARAQAVDASWSKEEVGSEGGLSVPVFVFLVRHLVRGQEAVQLEREWQVLQATGFTLEEATEFRSLFAVYASMRQAEEEEEQQAQLQQHQQQQPSLGALGRDIAQKFATFQLYRPLPELWAHLTEVPVARQEAVLQMLRQLGLRMSTGQRSTLKDKVKELSSASDGDTLDFACFLQVMRWLLDTNFANINAATEKACDDACSRRTRRTVVLESARRSVRPPSAARAARRVSLELVSELARKSVHSVS